MTKGKKQSLIAGALTSSAGIFISKALGLLYVVPFTAIAGEANMSFYSVAYTYYDILLSICSAGIPFAVAAMVAKYSNNEDYKTVILVRKLSMALMLLSGFVMAVLFIMVSGPLAASVLGAKKTPEDVAILRNVFMILSLAVVCVPFLSSFRGFYQGLKDLKSYAFSQVLEQLTRVVSLLALGAFFVYILDMNNIFAVYMAVLSTSLAAIAAIAYYLIYDRKHYQPIKELARHQTSRPKEVGELFQELLLFGLPYLITALLGNSMNIVNNNFFINTATSAGSSYEDAKLALGIIQVQCNKLTSIPQVLALGFSTGIVPYVTISLENRNFKELRRNVLDCLDTVLYIGAPLCFCLFALASPIYYDHVWQRKSQPGQRNAGMELIIGVNRHFVADLQLVNDVAALSPPEHPVSDHRLCRQADHVLSVSEIYRLQRRDHLERRDVAGHHFPEPESDQEEIQSPVCACLAALGRDCDRLDRDERLFCSAALGRVDRGEHIPGRRRIAVSGLWHFGHVDIRHHNGVLPAAAASVPHEPAGDGPSDDKAVCAMMRLDKFLAHAGFGTRKEVKELVRKGRVVVNGQRVKKDDQKIDERQDQIQVDGRIVTYETEVYIMLNKPQGVISATEDSRYETVLDCLKTNRSDLFPVGRLDIDTEGLLLITNDGALAHDLLSPKKHVDKTYEVHLERPWDPQYEAAIQTGIRISDEEVCLPATLRQTAKHIILLTIQEGKFHQVKRMMHACDNEVVYLKRLTMGPLKLDEALQSGAWRNCTPQEIEALKKHKKAEQ